MIETEPLDIETALAAQGEAGRAARCPELFDVGALDPAGHLDTAVTRLTQVTPYLPCPLLAPVEAGALGRSPIVARQA